MKNGDEDDEINRIFSVEKKQKELVVLLNDLIRSDGSCQTPISALSIHRATAPAQEYHGIQEPSFCVVAQGAKMARIGNERYQYNSAKYFVMSVDLPIVGQVVEASPERPYLCVKIKMSPSLVGELAIGEGGGADQRSSAKPPCKETRALAVSLVGYDLLDAVVRLVRTLYSSRDVKTLAPLILREIHYRLLTGEQGDMLRQITRNNSHAKRIAKAIYWMTINLDQPLRIENIAKEVAMSKSGFHHHFKAVTGLSPLQYQKQLRLYEARRMLMTGEADAATASYHVGYESPSQFSREYSRMFGAPPMRDILRNSS